MRRGKMQVFHLIHCIDKPLLTDNVRVILLIRDRCRRNQSAIIRVTCDTDQVIFIRLI